LFIARGFVYNVGVPEEPIDFSTGIPTSCGVPAGPIVFVGFTGSQFTLKMTEERRDRRVMSP